MFYVIDVDGIDMIDVDGIDRDRLLMSLMSLIIDAIDGIVLDVIDVDVTDVTDSLRCMYESILTAFNVIFGCKCVCVAC